MWTSRGTSKFANEKHFASWLGLCPGTKITGGKVMSGKTKRCAKRARAGAAVGGCGTAIEPAGAGSVLQYAVPSLCRYTDLPSTCSILRSSSG